MPAADPVCPLCEGRGGGTVFPYGTVWKGRRFDYLRCEGCGSSFIHPLPSEDDFGEMYSHSQYHQEFYQEVCEEGALTELKAALPLLKPAGTLLDFGCGNGSFLIAARNAGFRAEGVELDEQARARAADASGCIVSSLPAVQASGRRYDVIHLGDVLEHLPDPAAMMRQLETLLTADGLFFVEGPLEDNPSLIFYAARLFGAFKRRTGRNLFADLPPFHLLRTTARAQRRFFESRLGYEVRGFHVSESGWPYWNDGDRLLHPGSAGRFVRMLIGAAGVGLSKALGRTPLRIGNRFFAVAAPKAGAGGRPAL